MTMTHPISDDLSPARQHLIAIMRELRYGQIHDLTIEAGEPVLDPLPRLVRAVQICGQGRVLRRGGPCSRLKPHLLELFDEFDALGTGVIDIIKIQDGLPVHLQVEIRDHSAG